MPRRKRVAIPGVIFHVVNRGSRKGRLFDTDADYLAFERLLRKTIDQFDVSVFAYSLMPNHWHLVASPPPGATLSRAMQWLTGTHARRWHLRRGTAGEGAVYQGRFKAIPIQTDWRFLWVCRYVERNACRAGLVELAEAWRWGSLWQREHHKDVPWRRPWPVPRPADWLERVNRPETASELDAFRSLVRRNLPFGTSEWQERLGPTGTASRKPQRTSKGAKPGRKSVSSPKKPAA